MVLKLSKTCLLLLYALYLFLGSAYSNKYGEPEQELHRCQLSCVKQLQPYSKQAECQEKCVQIYKERREERGSFDDPQGKYKRCQKQCQEQEQSQQQQCRQTCQDEYEQQQREQEERGRQEGGKGRGDENPQIEDPRQRYEKCQEECRSSRGGDQQQECQTQCRKEYERQQREQEEREHRGEGGRGRSYYNPLVPPGKESRQRYEQCLDQCKSSPHGEQQQQCQTQCKKEYERQQRGGATGRGDDNPHVEERYQQCQQKCQSQERGQRRQYCLKQCEIKYKEEQGEEGHKHGEEGNISEKGEGRQENNPYYFQAQRFKTTFRTQEGNLRVVERFSERSELLQGIDNYRLALLEANPNTFIIPHHYDAESVCVVLQGKGIITLVQQDRRESFNLKQGDVIRVPAGTTLYLINHDNADKLYVAKLFKPVNTPGQFESYFGAGGENPESFYRAFSNEVLQAALNTPRERLERLFGQQKQGVIIRASQEQIKALSRHISTSSRKSKGPFNLFKEKPLFSNEFGEFFEASSDNYEHLRNLDLSVAFMNINQGAMIAPYYNSKSTKLVMVVEGRGRYEMACPHLSKQTHGSQGRSEQERGGAKYQKVSAQLSVGDAIIIPAGHPISIIASENEGLKLFGFGINAKNNKKNFLAGQGDNVWKHVQAEAKELSFKLPASEVEEIFKNQKQSYFLPGPGQHQEREEEARSDTVASKFMDFVGFF